MSLDSIVEQQIAKFVRTMPSLVRTAERAYAVCNSRQPDAMELYRVILFDPLLFCHTQALFNYLRPQETDRFHSIAEIILLLNVSTVKDRVLDAASRTVSAIRAETISKKTAENQRRFLLHSVASAIASRCIARARGVDELQFDFYYAAGLVHDLGEYFVIDNLDHCKTGASAAKALGLFEGLQDIIAWHHSEDRYEGRYADLLHTVVLADHIICRYMGLPDRGTDRDGQAVSTLEPDRAFCTEAAAAVEAEIGKLPKYIDMGERG